LASSSTKQTVGTLSLQTAPQAAAQALREAIISGELKGGDRILEAHWSSRLGIGQPTLREALKELEHQGLLKKQKQRGTYVTQLSPEDYQRILEIRIPLEAIAVGKATAKLTPESEKKLTDIVTTMASNERSRDTAVFHDCDVLFHRTIWTLADNEYLSELLETITFRLFVFSIVGRWPGTPNAKAERIAAVRQHRSILDGIKTGNPQKARRAFVKSTVEYWNERYGLKLNKENMLIEF
jgi:DNA-binding GntR family transcriptional regulator